MKKLFSIIGCLLLLGLGGCSAGSGSDEAATAQKDTAPKKSVFDGYVKDVHKAEQVQDKVDEAKKKMQAQLKQIDAGDDGGE